MRQSLPFLLTRMALCALCICILSTICAQNTLSALDSPLVIRSNIGDLTATINPNTGTIQLYRTGGGLKLTLVGSHYFLADLERWANKQANNKVDWSLLRTGAQTTPVYYDNKTSVIYQLDGKKNTIVMDTEDEFWAEIPEYDGIVAAAIGSTHLFLCVPSSHSLLVYKITGGSTIELAAVRNIGPDLMIPSILNSTPSPRALLKDLPAEVQDARENQLKQAEEAAANGEVPPLKKPEPWLAALQNDKIVIVEPANKKILTYEIKQKALVLKSVRSIDIDLMVPPGLSVNSFPAPHVQYKKYTKLMDKHNITPYTIEELTALAEVNGSHNSEKTGEDIQASIDERFNLVLDFTSLRKLILYRPDAGGAGIEMKSIRDYSLEIGTALHLDKITRERTAMEFYKAASKNLTPKKRHRAMRFLKRALSLKPSLYSDIESNKKIVRKLSGEAGWTELITTARTAHESEQANEEKRKKLLEDEKNPPNDND